MSYIVSKDSISISYKGQYATIYSNENESKYNEALVLCKDNAFQEAINLIKVSNKVLKQYSNGNITLRDGVIYLDNQSVGIALSERIVYYMDKGLDYKFLINFVKRCRLNPDQRAVEELFGFLDSGSFVITERGTIICHKVVRSDYKDIYSGKFDNSPGNTVSIPRKDVDTDKTRTCSYGLNSQVWPLVG